MFKGTNEAWQSLAPVQNQWLGTTATKGKGQGEEQQELERQGGTGLPGVF
jgi:hypothetical protein